MTILRILLALPILGLAVFSAMAAVAAHGGRTHVRLDVLTHFAPIWLVGGVMALLLCGVAPKGLLRVAVLLSSVTAIVASGALILPEYRRPISRAPADAPGQLKLIQFNNKQGFTRVKPATDWILAEQADVVVLEEASRGLVKSLKNAGYHSACGACDVVILSRARPIITDVPKVSDDDRAWAPTARATFADEDGGYTVVGVHTSWPTYGDFQQRQGRRIARVLDEMPKDRMILAGDFNSTPWSFSRRAEDALFGLERRTQGVFSWPTPDFALKRQVKSPLAFLAIDHVYAGRDWKTVSVKRGPPMGSDHYPVVVVLALDPQG